MSERLYSIVIPRESDIGLHSQSALTISMHKNPGKTKENLKITYEKQERLAKIDENLSNEFEENKRNGAISSHFLKFVADFFSICSEFLAFLKQTLAETRKT